MCTNQDISNIPFIMRGNNFLVLRLQTQKGFTLYYMACIFLFKYVVKNFFIVSHFTSHFFAKTLALITFCDKYFLTQFSVLQHRLPLIVKINCFCDKRHGTIVPMRKFTSRVKVYCSYAKPFFKKHFFTFPFLVILNLIVKGALSDLFISYLLNILISSSFLSSKRMK